MTRTHCKRGTHPWIPENLGTDGEGYNYCKLCSKESERRRAEKKKKPRTPDSAVPEPWRAAYEDGRAVRARFDAKRQAEMAPALERLRQSLREAEAA